MSAAPAMAAAIILEGRRDCRSITHLFTCYISYIHGRRTCQGEFCAALNTMF